MRFVSGLLGSLFCLGLSAGADPTIEDYAAGPEYSGASLSADGNMLSVIHTIKGEEYLCVIDIEARSEACHANVGSLQANGSRFLDEEHVIVLASNRQRLRRTRWSFDFTNPYLVNIVTGEVDNLVRRNSGIDNLQTGFGRISAFDDEQDIVYLPAYGRSSGRFDVFEVPLDDGRAQVQLRGARDTVGWLVAPDGEAIARENFDGRDDEYTVEVPDGRSWRTIHTSSSEERHIFLHSVTEARDQLVLTQREEDDSIEGVYYMSLQNGELTGPFLSREGREIEGVYRNRSGEFLGVVYAGMTSEYAFLDENLDAAMSDLVASVPAGVVDLVDISDDQSRILIRVSGQLTSGSYAVYDIPTSSYVFTLAQRPWISAEQMGNVQTIEYAARDGLNITAVLTWPQGAGAGQGEAFPMVVLPHGGPESYDDVGFDWLAQAIASRGYLVFQPNFRGSSGFGREFALAGRGEWGRAMQNDVTDGVHLLTAQGWADPSRTCIVGWSYGGYAALAGGAFTPDLYSCVVSIAGVSDLHEMLENTERRDGDDSAAYRYWVEQYGQDGTRRDDLRPVSPYFHAEAFQAPVLLMHGDDDQIVPVRQSERMEDALDDAGKSVRLVVFEDQTHSILDDADRARLLNEIIGFLDQHTALTTSEGANSN